MLERTTLNDDYVREQTIESVINYFVSLLGIGEGAVYRITLLGLKSPNDDVKTQRPPLDVNAHQIGHGDTDVNVRSPLGFLSWSRNS